MNTKLNYILSLAMLFVMASGCQEEFLERPPKDQLTAETFYRTDEEVLKSTSALYNRPWFPYIDDAMIALGDVRAGNVQTNDRFSFLRFNVAATNGNVRKAWNAFYNVINMSNLVLQNLRTEVSVDVSEDVLNNAKAEARFMRGTCYMYLVMTFGSVPVIYNSIEQLEQDTTMNKVVEEDVWEFAIRDMRYAKNNLPENPPNPGRVTSWSAKGMLAKMFLFRSGLTGGSGSRNQQDLDSAAHYAGDVINNSGLSLMDSYEALFDPENDNNEEGLFALHWLGTSEPWGVNNPLQAYYAYDPQIDGVGGGWGGAQGASADIVKYYENNPADSIRRKATFMFNGTNYPEISYGEGDSTLFYNSDTTIAHVKKWVVGRPEDNDGDVDFMAIPLDAYMLRLAEVHLIYADALMGNSNQTSNQEAVSSFNRVRERAGMPTVNTVSRKDLREEKRAELALEGQYWYHIMAWYYWQPGLAKAYLAGQDKGSYTMVYDTASKTRTYNYPTVEDEIRFYEPTDEDMYLPLPEVEVASYPNLLAEPQPFDFSQLPENE